MDRKPKLHIRSLVLERSKLELVLERSKLVLERSSLVLLRNRSLELHRSMNQRCAAC